MLKLFTQAKKKIVQFSCIGRIKIAGGFISKNYFWFVYKCPCYCYPLLFAARKVRYIGPYLAGIITIGGYMAALTLAAPRVFGEPLFQGAGDLPMLIGVTVIGGFIAGFAWFRERTPEQAAKDVEIDRREEPLFIAIPLAFIIGLGVILNSRIAERYIDWILGAAAVAIAVAWIWLRRRRRTA